MVVVISDKVDILPRNKTGDKEGHYIMMKWSIHQEDLAILNLYATKLQRLEAKLIKRKGKTDKSTTIFGDFNTPFSKKVDKEN